MNICKAFITALLVLTSLPATLCAQSSEWKLMHEGNAAFRQRQFDRAQANYMRVLKHNPGNARARFNLADTYLAKGDWQLADSLYNMAATAERNPQVKAMALHNRGYIRQMAALADQQNRQQLLRQAIECYKQALRLNPHDNDTRYNLVLCQRQLRNSPDNNQNKDQQKKQQQEQQDKKQQQQVQEQKVQLKEDKNRQSKEQTEQYINLSRQAERNARERINARQPRQRQLDKNW